MIVTRSELTLYLTQDVSGWAPGWASHISQQLLKSSPTNIIITALTPSDKLWSTPVTFCNHTIHSQLVNIILHDQKHVHLSWKAVSPLILSKWAVWSRVTVTQCKYEIMGNPVMTSSPHHRVSWATCHQLLVFLSPSTTTMGSSTSSSTSSYICQPLSTIMFWVVSFPQHQYLSQIFWRVVCQLQE